MKKILYFLLFSTILLTACTSPDSQSTNKLVDSNKGVTESSKDSSEQEDATESSTDTSEEETSASDDNIAEENVSEKVKDYITNGQENKPEAQKLKWSNTFLNQVDIESLCEEYISKGGNVDNLENLAEYVTLNATIPSDWEKLFEEDLYDKYGEKVTRLEHLEGDLYQAYIKKDGSEIPYVVVSSRTGYFHG